MGRDHACPGLDLVCGHQHRLPQGYVGRFRYLWYYGPLVVCEFAALYGLMGWSFFQPWLPATLWHWVDGHVVRDLQFILNVMIGSRAFLALAIFLDSTWGQRRLFRSAALATPARRSPFK